MFETPTPHCGCVVLKSSPMKRISPDPIAFVRSADSTHHVVSVSAGHSSRELDSDWSIRAGNKSASTGTNDNSVKSTYFDLLSIFRV